ADEAQATGERSAAPVPAGRREPLAADRGRDRLPGSLRVHRAHGADDERPGALRASLAEPVSVAELRRRVPPGADPPLGPEHDDLRLSRNTRRAGLERPGGVRALTDPLARPEPRLRAR